MPRNVQLIVNPISGTKSNRGEIVESVVEALSVRDINVRVTPTQYAGHATDMARQAAEKRNVDAVLVCGGDGTVNEVVRGLLGTEMPMGLIPNGSGNGLARHLTIPADPVMSVDTIVKGHVEACDCGEVNGIPFACTFGMGYDAAVADRFANSGKRGKMSYIKSAAEEFLHYSHEQYTIHIDGRTITDDAFLVVCCNASQYGNNAYIAPQASITDGLLDIVVVRKAAIIPTLMALAELPTGTIDRNRILETYRCAELIIERTAPGSAHIDGEPLEMPEVVTVRCLPSSLRIITPEGRTHFRPLITPAEDLLRDIRITLSNILNPPMP